jgi:exopolyphosphatase/guanosine-5'-triphosphate,3'-diphosphate pyrophosphatase
VLSHTAIAAWLDRLASLTVEEIRALPSMHPGRADVITGGTLVVQRVGQRVGAPGLVVSETDILDGIALALFERTERGSGSDG